MRWVERSRRLRETEDGRYMIFAQDVAVCEHRIGRRFVVRHIAGEAVAESARGVGLGRPVAEETSWETAVVAAERHAGLAGHQGAVDVRADYQRWFAGRFRRPVAIERFQRPVSDGTNLGALVVVQEGGRIVAQVLGMVLADDRYELRVHAAMDVAPAPDESLPGRARRAVARFKTRVAASVRGAAAQSGVSHGERGRAPLEWLAYLPHRWSTPDKTYVIALGAGPRSQETYVVRRVPAGAPPECWCGGLAGYFVGEGATLDEAKSVADAHAARVARAGSADVPEDALVLDRDTVNWWASDGSAVDALVLECERGRVLVRVVALKACEGADGFEPVVRAQVDVTRWRAGRQGREWVASSR